jgi:predicted Zn finger-like uncharacterized protein
LYTQCSHCDTVFQLTAETLRAAGGQVRCGRCGEVFNALARLAEDASAFPTPGESAAGESALEMEARADEILQSPQPARSSPPATASDPEDLEATDVEFARLQLIEKFNPPRNETSTPPRNAVPPKAAAPPAPPARPASGAASARSPAPKAKPSPAASEGVSGQSAAKDVAPTRASGTGISISPESADQGALEFTLPPGELDRVFVDPTATSTRRSSSISARPGADASMPNERMMDERAEPAAPAAERMSGLDVAEHVRRDVLAGLRQRRFDERSEVAQPQARRAWGGAGAALGLLLLGQVLHENRAWLAAHGPLRGPLQGLYAALGVKVQPPVNLSAYQLRQWGVTGDPSAAGTLRVRASILNTSAQLQPYPLLRVTLANRFGTHIGTRDFEPAEYLGHPNARLMTPGERADATLDIQDPGKDAEGFEIDVCLRADQTISCAADVATQAGASPGKP